MKVDTSATATASLFARLSLSSTSSSQQTTTMTTTTTTPQQELSSRRSSSSSSSSSSSKLFSMAKPLYGIPAKNTQQQLLCTISNAIATFPDEEKEEMELVVQKSEPSSSSSSSHGPQQERQHPSVMLPSSNDYAINPKAWSKLSPVVWDRISSRDYGEEIRMEWKENNYSNDDDTDLLAVAKMVVDEMNTNEWFVDYDNDDERNNTDLSNTINKFYPTFRLLNIESSMKSFVSICQSNLNDIMGYRIKVCIMHGKSATRCPSWHTDYVPIRWIQSMVGPGSDFINDDGNNDGDDDDVISYLQRVRNNDKEYEVQEGNDRPDWKDILVERSHVQIQQVPTGQPLVIVGNAWSEWSKEEDTSPSIGRRRYGILHRSPQNVPKDQGRILLVLDVIHGRDDNNSNDNSNKNSNNYSNSNNKNKNKENNSPCEEDCCSSQKTLN